MFTILFVYVGSTSFLMAFPIFPILVGFVFVLICTCKKKRITQANIFFWWIHNIIAVEVCETAFGNYKAHIPLTTSPLTTRNLFLLRDIWRMTKMFHDIRYSPCPTCHTALLHDRIHFLHARNFDHIFTNILYKTTLNQNFDTAMIQFN